MITSPAASEQPGWLRVPRPRLDVTAVPIYSQRPPGGGNNPAKYTGLRNRRRTAAWVTRRREIRNSKFEDNKPRMKHGLNTDSDPCSNRVPTVAGKMREATMENSKSEIR